jgi:hypothetical protein
MTKPKRKNAPATSSSNKKSKISHSSSNSDEKNDDSSTIYDKEEDRMPIIDIQATSSSNKKSKISHSSSNSDEENDDSSTIYGKEEDRMPIIDILNKKVTLAEDKVVGTEYNHSSQIVANDQNKVVGTECYSSSQIVANDDIKKILVPQYHNKMIDQIFCTLPQLEEEKTEVEAMNFSYYVSHDVKVLIKSNNLNLEDILTEKKQSNSSYLNYDVLFQPFVKLVVDKINTSHMLNYLNNRDDVIRRVNTVAELLLTPLVLTLRLSKLFGPKKESYEKFYHHETLHSTMKETIEIMPAKSGVSNTDGPRTMTKKSIKDNTREVCTFNYMIYVLLTIKLYH